MDEKTTERSTIQRTRSQATTEQGTARPQAITEQATTQAATQQPATQQPATQQPATQQPTTQHEHEWQPIREMEFRRYCSTCHMDLTSAGIDPETHSINSGTYIVDVGGTPMEFYNCAGSYGGYEYITVGYFCHCGATKTCNEE